MSATTRWPRGECFEERERVLSIGKDHAQLVWRGGANWYSEAMELNIDAQGSGDGLVTLHVELRRFAHLDPAATGEIVLSFDEIRQFTRSLGSFLRVCPAAPTEVPAAKSPLGRWSFTDSPHREDEAFV